jgi:ubiquinone/menaquinone biosynthesis C-methylase UbiE
MALYDRIGKGYDDTRRADPYIVERLLRHLRPSAGGRYLDVGCGTGNYTSALSQRGLMMVGLDVSPTMIRKAAQKAPGIRWQIGTADSMPFGSGSFDGAISVNAHHHFTSVRASFDEIFRVLRPGSRLVMFHSTAEQMRGYWLNEYFPRMMARSIDQFDKLQTVATLEASGFEIERLEPYSVRPGLLDNFLYCGKNRPQMYLDPHIRSGISLFAQIAEQEEVERGGARLASDIDSGRIDEVIRTWRNDAGDYTFTVASKTHSVRQVE